VQVLARLVLWLLLRELTHVGSFLIAIFFPFGLHMLFLWFVSVQ